MSLAPLTVGIAGAGSIALASAALLESLGHRPVLWSPSGAGTKDLRDAPLRAHGAVVRDCTPGIADTAADLAQADVLMIALPGYGHRQVLEALAPHIRPGQWIVYSSHMSFGALCLNRLLTDRGIDAPIAVWGTTVVTGRRQGPQAVNVNTIRAEIDMSTLPRSAEDDGLALCQHLLGDRFRLRDGLLAIAMSNLNPQNHMGIALGNMTRMERAESWSQGQNVTPNVGRLLENLDQERLQIARALNVETRTIFDHFHLSFHVPRASISEMNQQMHAAGNGGTGPATADSRYVTEDVPYGLAVTEAVGRLTGVPTPVHSAGIDIFGAMYGRDFRAENTLLDLVPLDRMSLPELRKAATAGFAQDRSSGTPPLNEAKQGETI